MKAIEGRLDAVGMEVVTYLRTQATVCLNAAIALETQANKAAQENARRNGLTT